MQGFLLQRLSSQRLLALLIACGVLMLIFFIVGEAIYPNYDRTQSVEEVLVVCDGRTEQRKFDRNSCPTFPNLTEGDPRLRDAVHMLKLPVGGGSVTPWNQFLIISLQMNLEIGNNLELTAGNKDNPQIEVKLTSRFYRKKFGFKRWELFSGVEQTRSSFNCRILQDKITLRCDATAYFELDSVNHEFYLLNIRSTAKFRDNDKVDVYVKQLKAKVTLLREKFTKSFMAIKLLCFPLSLIALLWHINRAKQFDEDETTFRGKHLIAAGIAIVFLNLPIEWLTLWVSLPPIQLLYDIRLVIFYAALFYFSVGFLRYFAEERPRRFRINCCCYDSKFYTVDVAVPIVCLSLVVFYVCYRVSILANFFYSYGVSQSVQEAVLAYIATVGVLAGLFSLYQVLPVVWSIPALRQERQYSTRVTYYVTMVATVAVLLLTVTYFLIADIHGLLVVYGRVFKISGALYTGIYGVWNIYVLSFLYLFAPIEIPEVHIEMVEDVDIIDAGIKLPDDTVDEERGT